MKREEVLDTAKQLICQDRKDIHGNAENCFGLIADYWHLYLSQKFQTELTILPDDVAVMMSLFKIARRQINPDHMDSTIDAIGYLALSGELHISNTR